MIKSNDPNIKINGQGNNPLDETSVIALFIMAVIFIIVLINGGL